VCFLSIIVFIGFLSIIVVIVVIYVVVIINIVVIITHVVGLMVISSVELIAFLIIIVGMPTAVSSHGRIALNMVDPSRLTLTTDHSLLELECLTCARRVSDGVALATHMKLTVGTLPFMASYLAEHAEIRAVVGAMIETTMSADHNMRCKDYAKMLKPFPNRLVLLFVYFRFAGPCQPARLSGCDPHCWMCTVRLVLSSEVRTCVRTWCPLLAFVRA
jgi:hypothetical protein